MASKYRGSVQEKCEDVQVQPTFDWVALSVWFSSIIISAIPVYAYMLLWLNDSANTNKTRWDLAFDCIAKQDVLWIFSTVLLFAIVNCALNYLTHKTKSQKNHVTFFMFLGILDFVFLEITWGLFKYIINNQSGRWPVYLGMVLIAVSVISATPLQIDAIKSEAR